MIARPRTRRGVDPGPPKLSVVIPAYDVASYVGECLASLRSQPFAAYEAIVVDDGSTDATPRILARHARRDPRIRVVRQENAGPSAARNLGVREARGEYLTFVDADDVLPADAWSRMVGSLDATGSDLAVGMLERFTRSRRLRRTHRFATERMRRNHREDRIATTVEEMPSILADVFPVNKVYRRSFWDRTGLEFPVGMNYEDQPVLTQAFLAARGIDVLSDLVYLYRVRADSSSRTQSRHELADLVDRVATKRSTISQVRAHGSPEVVRVLHTEVLPVDMWEYFRGVPGCTDEFWALLREAVNEMWGPDTVPFDQTHVPVQQRLMGWLVSRGRRSDLERLITWLDSFPGDPPVEDERLLHPWRDEPDLPPGVTVLAAHPFELSPPR